MDVFPKFIIETDDEYGDCLIIAKCTYHKQLVTDTKQVKGGGWWTLDSNNKTFTLFGRSEDFGQAKLDDILNCVKNKRVYSSKSLHRNLCKDYKFNYKNELGEIIKIQ